MSQLAYFRGSGRAARHAELLKDVVHVVLHGRQLDRERLCDLLVHKAAVDQLEDLSLSRRQQRQLRTSLIAREPRDSTEQDRSQPWRACKLAGAGAAQD